MHSYNTYSKFLELPFDFKHLEYRKQPDVKFNNENNSLLGELYNDKLDCGKHDLSHLNVNGWKNFAWCFYKLAPGKWIPPHKDHFQNYSIYYRVKDSDKIRRTMIFLEDWKPGHVFGIEDKVVIGWNAHDSYTWDNDTEHWGGNFGESVRYNLQLTGTDDS